jgi:hypothetical protein
MTVFRGLRNATEGVPYRVLQEPGSMTKEFPMGRASRFAAFLALAMTAVLANAQERSGNPWRHKIDVDPKNVAGDLAAAKLDSKQPVNWFTGRWPYISFLGGMVMGNRSEDLEFFYSEPFQWHSTVLDYVLTGGGKVYGLRAKFHRYKEEPNPKPMRSFLLSIRTDVLLAEYHPSYILANGRRVWDFKKHKMGAGSIQVPFSVEEPSDVTIDLVVDKDYTPDTQGLAFRMFFLNYLGEPGVKVDLAGAESKASGSPAEKLRRFVFGLYPGGYDFWTRQGVPFAEIRKSWKPNFRPEYPTDDVALCPFCFDGVAKGKYHEFMTSYGGCDVAPSFAGDVVADWVYPLVQAMRFAMVHPARGRPIVPVGIVYGAGDAWWIPYNPFGQMDTFQRYIGYDHATGKLACEPAFTKVFPWMPQQGPQWNCSVGNRPLVLRKPLGKGMLYVYLGRWVWQGADALRSVLAYAGRQSAPLVLDKPDDQLEYVAYRKNRGAWVALFNHGNIVVGCDRLDPSTWRVAPPEPLCTKPRGPYRGTIGFRLDRLDLDPSVEYALYQVLGIDGPALDGVISGRKTFEVRSVPFQSRGGVIRASVEIDKRAQYVIAPRGEGKDVFFGKP